MAAVVARASAPAFGGLSNKSNNSCFADNSSTSRVSLRIR